MSRVAKTRTPKMGFLEMTTAQNSLATMMTTRALLKTCLNWVIKMRMNKKMIPSIWLIKFKLYRTNQNKVYNMKLKFKSLKTCRVTKTTKFLDSLSLNQPEMLMA
jgi:hypothetical protein